MARLARTLWGLGKCVRSILLLAQKRTVGTDFTFTAATSRCQGRTKLGHSSRRWQCYPSSPTRSGGKKGHLDPQSLLSQLEQVQQREALGRSKAGFSTKIHLRCEGNGLPLTFWLTVGERHEAVVFEQLMEQAVSNELALVVLACVQSELWAIRVTAAAKSALTCVVVALA